MSVVVVHAHLVAGLALPLPYSLQAQSRFTEWVERATPVNGPTLLEYEVAALVARAAAAGKADHTIAQTLLRRILSVGIVTHPPTPELHERALAWAERLRWPDPTFAHYLALAEALGAELWVADPSLAKAAHEGGAPGVKCL